MSFFMDNNFVYFLLFCAEDLKHWEEWRDSLSAISFSRLYNWTITVLINMQRFAMYGLKRIHWYISINDSVGKVIFP